jgi:hypothetical protein
MLANAAETIVRAAAPTTMQLLQVRPLPSNNLVITGHPPIVSGGRTARDRTATDQAAPMETLAAFAPHLPAAPNGQPNLQLAGAPNGQTNNSQLGGAPNGQTNNSQLAGTPNGQPNSGGFQYVTYGDHRFLVPQEWAPQMQQLQQYMIIPPPQQHFPQPTIGAAHSLSTHTRATSQLSNGASGNGDVRSTVAAGALSLHQAGVPAVLQQQQAFAHFAQPMMQAIHTELQQQQALAKPLASPIIQPAQQQPQLLQQQQSFAQPLYQQQQAFAQPLAQPLYQQTMMPWPFCNPLVPAHGMQPLRQVQLPQMFAPMQGSFAGGGGGGGGGGHIQQFVPQFMPFMPQSLFPLPHNSWALPTPVNPSSQSVASPPDASVGALAAAAAPTKVTTTPSTEKTPSPCHPPLHSQTQTIMGQLAVSAEPNNQTQVQAQPNRSESSPHPGPQLLDGKQVEAKQAVQSTRQQALGAPQPVQPPPPPARYARDVGMLVLDTTAHAAHELPMLEPDRQMSGNQQLPNQQLANQQVAAVEQKHTQHGRWQAMFQSRQESKPLPLAQQLPAITTHGREERPGATPQRIAAAQPIATQSTLRRS